MIKKQRMDGVEKSRTPTPGRRAGHSSRNHSISRSLSRASWSMEEVFSGGVHSRRNSVDEDEEALKWAAIERLPTYERLRTGIIKSFFEGELQGNKKFEHKEVDVTKLDANDRQKFIDTVFRVAEEDNEKFLKKFRQRIDKVGIRLPTVEVRFEHLTVEADCHIGTRALPTLPNVARNIAESVDGTVIGSSILWENNPFAGTSRKVIGDITYNGYKLNEFVPQKSSAYISQNDVHIGALTVKETLDFSARCQGVGTRYDLLSELARRERDAGIIPEAEVDLFMKATAMKGVESSLITDYTLKASDGITRLGIAVLQNFDVFRDRNWYWIGVAALAGFAVLFNLLENHKQSSLRKRAVVKKAQRERKAKEEAYLREIHFLREIMIQRMRSMSNPNGTSGRNDSFQEAAIGVAPKRGMVLPFTPLAMSFDSVNYYVDMPAIFVDEVMELVELENLKDALVGLPGVTGLSTEQRKRLTIAVELVANPSIIFMDEPTSGLDARAAAIVMRTVRNTVDTGRTVVCTIHQPSIDIFEAFDELLLLKRGGQVIYSGPLGRNSRKVIEYFEDIPGVPKIKDKYNPATWMLEVSSVAVELRLGMDFAEYYRSSPLYQRNKALVKELSTPPPGAKDLYFDTQYSESTWGQFKSCLWKQWWTYWRSPDYNLVRFCFTFVCSLMMGTIFWKVVTEIPYVFFQTTYYTLIVYSMIAFEWTAAKFFWFFFIAFFSFLYFTYYGMMTVSITPNHEIASVFAATFYSLFNLFSGFFIPRPKIPKWWIWYYWICPVAWTVYGLIVSQYGDNEKTIKVPGMSPDPQIKDYISDHFGYHPDFIGEKKMDGIEMSSSSRRAPPAGYKFAGSISRSLSRASRRVEEVLSSGLVHSMGSTRSADQDEEALKWAAIEKLPTYNRLRTSLMTTFTEDAYQGLLHKEVDVTKLDVNDRQNFINKVFKVAEEDNEKFLRKFRQRIDRVGIQLPKIEVRFENLTIEADCYVGNRALPTLLNSARNMAESAVGLLGISFAKKRKLTILKDASGVIKPSRMALLLGPPSSGKTTLLLALAGKLDPSLKVDGSITYNGVKLNEFEPRKSSAYISQNDVHTAELTVKETLDFSARCQGVGTRYDLMTELARREKAAGILPEAEVDLFMKATAMKGVESSLITDYTLKIVVVFLVQQMANGLFRLIAGATNSTTTRLGEQVLDNIDVYNNKNWYWIGKQATISEEEAAEIEERENSKARPVLSSSAANNTNQVMELVELDNLKDALVGLPGITGLSTEQRKRLTIAVELVANPSIIFMDEPTSGLDARAAAIVMRTVRNTVETGRAVVCTIHQPSIDIFEAFDELLLMKRGGQVIYAGPLGQHSHKIVEYFEAVPGVPKIKEKYNPATWMLEVSSVAVELRLGMDFAEHYKQSSLFQRNKALVKELSTPPPGAKDLYFETQYSESLWGQFKSCLWKQWWTYWRSPDYNVVRFLFTLCSALMLGTIFWNIGTKKDNAANLTVIIGALYAAVLFCGINNCSSVQPVVATERTVFYRERAAGMYSSLPYALAQSSQQHSTRSSISSPDSLSRDRIPKWWVWYYWICPVAWTVYGLIVSQYGDLTDTVKIAGTDLTPRIKDYIEDHFGYKSDFMGPVAVVLIMDGIEVLSSSRRMTSQSNLAGNISRSFSRASRRMEEVFSSGLVHSSRRSSNADQDEEALKWAAIEKLPTYNRLRTSLIASFMEGEEKGDRLGHKEVDVTKLDMSERQKFIDHVFRVAEEDNEKFLKKFRQRIDKVGIQLPKIEVRFEHLTIEADCYVGNRALPTLINSARNMAESAVGMLGINFAKRRKLTILKDVSGIIKPSRMTLLLGPPSSGKTTLLLALAGKLDPSLKVEGDITYNGYKLSEFVPQKSSAYISQNDVHTAELTVKETFDFSARCQGVGTRYDLLAELARREKAAGIIPEADVDLFMKATSMEGVESSLITDYTLKVFQANSSDGVTKLGSAVLRNYDVYENEKWYWIGVGAVTGFAILFNVLFTMTLAYFSRKLKHLFPHKRKKQMEERREAPKSRKDESSMEAVTGVAPKRGMVLPFNPLAMLTIAVELVANPSIIFMDEPTSGLDARAAAIVMRTVRNTVDTGRTVVCTIHQPSIDIFEAFDELLLMKRGGQVIYSGPLGQHSHKMIEYFEAIPGVPKIREKYNPATWMLEVSSIAAEVRLGMDFAEYYKSSSLYQRNQALVRELSTPPPGATDLHFDTQYSESMWGQFKSCLWKQWITYWRSPDYNIVRILFTLCCALILGTIFWDIGSKKERAAGMYSSLPYALSQVIAEIPYVLLQSSYYSLIVYSMLSFEWTAAKFFWFFYVTFFTMLYFTYYGMMTVSLTPNHQLASVFAATFYALFNLFSGFFIPRPKIPKWWIWYYWICPVSWTVYGLIVSQFGDVTDTIKLPGSDQSPRIKDYLDDHFGYKSDFMAPVAVVLVAFPVTHGFNIFREKPKVEIMDGIEILSSSRRMTSPNNLAGNISRSFSRASRRMEEVFSSGLVHSSRRSSNADQDEEALKWAAIEKLPTYNRLRTSLIASFMEGEQKGDRFGHKEVDVTKLDMSERQKFIDNVFRVAEEDNEKFLKKFRQRIDKVGIQLPKIEVRFEHLTIEADCYVGTRALPTLINSARNMAESAVGMLGINFAKRKKLTILKDVSGIVKPSRMTLLLGPPASGKTTLLLALAGKLDPSLKVEGDITYNGYKLSEFVPQKSSAYISQNDIHTAELTVKETFDFSARCQGVGTRYAELARREKAAGILPEADVDLFMKVFQANFDSKMPVWWEWAYWASPMTYTYNALTVNEFTSPRWMDKLTELQNWGQQCLKVMTFTKTPLQSHKQYFLRKKQTEKRGKAPKSRNNESSMEAVTGVAPKRGMVLPFNPLAMSFDCVNYYVDMPSLFVDQVMELVELDNLKDALVGLPGVTGLSTEQRKRLTIAVELVANPSIIFMDEPTSGLDARAAAIVMRTVRNTVDTGRTVVCTIHQPSIDIFEAFDELLLMKRGGQVIYSGPLGQHSHKMIEYFEAIPGVPKIRERYNPATWMLEVSSIAAEVRLGMDFAEYYKSSSLYQRNQALVRELSTPPPGATDLHFDTQYSESMWGQFKSCLWKQWITYWRSPDYNLVRILFTLCCALILGTIFWDIGSKKDNATDLTAILGALYASVLFAGINNCSTVQPVVAVERTVFYRERAAGMYSSLPYAMAQVIAEIPYVLLQSSYYSLIVYSMLSFEWTAAKFFWFYYVTFFTMLYFTYYGMMTVSLTPNHQLASVFAATFYALFNLFSGFFIPRPKIPKWWIWYYWICPVSWTVYGLIVSQFGDVTDTIKLPGSDQSPRIKDYLDDHFGYKSDFMAPVAVVLVAFPIVFAFLYAYCIRTLNFQTR
ncbi:hypothetical protein Tsubulata_041743 [Turnera subulata]|uniref:ABC transporter domain-containing protein n=1 Tax=Turnera subulata TaxID=218843 RepID=A0A9Q0IZA0_9ROSI|nr:hypothetical protein Tsubulata_041743 [Turnera subulata]